jgi:hypothetical protein
VKREREVHNETSPTGWAVGRNVQIDLRWGAANNELHRKYAAELVALAPDVVWAFDWSLLSKKFARKSGLTKPQRHL